MNEQNLLSLFFLDSQGNENYGLALVPGKYVARTGTEAQQAYLIVFICLNCDSFFSFYFVDADGNYLRHVPLYAGEESIEYVLLEAWLKFDVLPYYWILAEENEQSATLNKHLESDCKETYIRLRELLSRFRWAESTKAKPSASLTISSPDKQQYDLNRAFYPDIPPEVLTPLTL